MHRECTCLKKKIDKKETMKQSGRDYSVLEGAGQPPWEGDGSLVYTLNPSDLTTDGWP